MRTFLLIVIVLGAPSAAAMDFTGSYTVHAPSGDMELVLEQMQEREVRGLLDGPNGSCEVTGRAVRDEEEEWSVEGSMVCDLGSGQFVLSYDEEDDAFLLLLVPDGADGAPRSEAAAFFEVVRGTSTRTPEVPPGTLDPGLVGTWATQVIVNTPAGSLATQIFMEIRSDGLLVDLGSRTVSGADGYHLDTGLESTGEVMNWRTNAGVLELSHRGSPWVPLARYELDEDRLLLRYYDGDQKLWYRR